MTPTIGEAGSQKRARRNVVREFATALTLGQWMVHDAGLAGNYVAKIVTFEGQPAVLYNTVDGPDYLYVAPLLTVLCLDTPREEGESHRTYAVAYLVDEARQRSVIDHAGRLGRWAVDANLLDIFELVAVAAFGCFDSKAVLDHLSGSDYVCRTFPPFVMAAHGTPEQCAAEINAALGFTHRTHLTPLWASAVVEWASARCLTIPSSLHPDRREEEPRHE